jgi:hypothetical protein
MDAVFNAELLNRFGLESDEMLRTISAHVDDRMLRTIASADYGEEIDEHYRHLVAIRDSRTFPIRKSWIPCEVLELIRWSRPDLPDWKPGESGEIGHWLRAFCCAALLRAQCEPWNWQLGCSGNGNFFEWTGMDSTVVHLVLSLCELPVNLAADAAGFLGWTLAHADFALADDLYLSFGIAMLYLVLLNRDKFSDGDALLLAQEIASGSSSEGPCKAVRESQTPESWRVLSKRFETLDYADRSIELKDWAELARSGVIG